MRNRAFDQVERFDNDVLLTETDEEEANVNAAFKVALITHRHTHAHTHTMRKATFLPLCSST